MTTVLRAIAGLALALVAAGASGELIEIDVQVVEVNRTKLTTVGLDWVRLLEGGAAAISPKGPLEFLEGGDGTVGKLGTFERGRVDAFVRLLQDRNYGKLLAKPKLLTMSGSPASFLVGGELPIVLTSSQGHLNLTWKEYGVKLAIKPERKGEMIRTHVRAESSTIDAANAVRLPQGSYVPSLKTRWAETDVELASKATVIIAGLIQKHDVESASGVPVLADLPVLGWLFRHTRIEEVETELIIFVTPSFVAPAGLAGSA